MGIKQTIARVLREPAVGKIKFSLDNLRVIGKDFIGLKNRYNALYDHQKLKVIIDPTINSPANYNARTVTISFKNSSVGSDVFSKACIVHECCHEWMLRDTVWTPWSEMIQHECAGFIVQTLYLYLNLSKVSATNRKLIESSIYPKFFGTPATKGAEGIAQQAFAIIEKFQLHKKQAALKSNDYEALRRVIASHPKYYSQWTPKARQ